MHSESTRKKTAAQVPPLPADADFKGAKILVVDGDMRNIFAITSVHESRGVNALCAEDGRASLRVLQENATLRPAFR